MMEIIIRILTERLPVLYFTINVYPNIFNTNEYLSNIFIDWIPVKIFWEATEVVASFPGLIFILFNNKFKYLL